jgi:hypothetical protein
MNNSAFDLWRVWCKLEILYVRMIVKELHVLQPFFSFCVTFDTSKVGTIVGAHVRP